jgi:hypothetical protein
MPSYVYPWNLEYSEPRRESYSNRYSSAVCKKHTNTFSSGYAWNDSAGNSQY